MSKGAMADGGVAESLVFLETLGGLIPWEVGAEGPNSR